jgi:hypothetical protein
MAVGRRKPGAGLVQHADQGSQLSASVARDMPLILQDHAGKNRPSHIFVLSQSFDALKAVIALTVDEGAADWR